MWLVCIQQDRLDVIRDRARRLILDAKYKAGKDIDNEEVLIMLDFRT